MSIEAITHLSQEDFESLIESKKSVLIYPQSATKNALLAQFVGKYGDRLLYHSFTPVTTLAAALQSMVESQSGSFSRLAAVLKKKASSPQDFAAALAKDLATTDQKPVALYLDDVDTIGSLDNFSEFMQALVESLPKNAQIIVNARQLTTQPWNILLEKGDAVVLGMGYREDENAFRADADQRPLLEIYAFGRGHALVNGTPIDHWDGALPRSLFFYFADHEMVSRDQIFKVFWPDLTVKEATNVYHVTKRKISERITTHSRHADADYEFTNYANGFYHPSDSVQRHYDVADFTTALEQAAATTDETEQERLYRRALDIYKAPFLSTMVLPWVEERREKLRLMYVDVLIDMSRLQKRKGHYAEALGYFLRALKEVPQREDIHREAMTMYWKLGAIDDALNQYTLLEDYLQRTVGVRPSRDTRELHDRIQAEGAAAQIS